MTNSIKNPISVSIIGGSGYTGAELMRLIAKHPYFRLVQIVANRNAGKKTEDIFPHLRHLNLPSFISFEEMNFDSELPAYFNEVLEKWRRYTNSTTTN